MTVKGLIETLQKVDGELDVRVLIRGELFDIDLVKEEKILNKHEVYNRGHRIVLTYD